MSANAGLLIANHGPTPDQEYCRLCQQRWPCAQAMAAIKEGVRAAKEGRTMPADTFFEWMQARYVRDIWDARVTVLERQLAESQEKLEIVARWAGGEGSKAELRRILKEEK